MKTLVFLALIAFFLGIALFGFFKSLTLFSSNLVLTHKVGLLAMDLDTAQTSLKQTRSALSDSYMKSAELEGSLKYIETKLSNKEKEAQELLDTINKLSQELKDASDVNDILSGANRELSDRSLRIELENSELKNKFSSIEELKLAIKELKIKMRAEKQRKPKQPAPREKKSLKPVVLSSPPLDNKIMEGNMGFFMKDGKSTFDRFVDIEVVPAEERGL